VDDSSAELHKASLGYQLAKTADIQLGFIKQPFGLESSTGSKRLRTLERTMASNAFSPDRGVGITFSKRAGNAAFSAGFYEDKELDDVQSASIRAVWAPISEKRRVLHFGTSYSVKDNAQNEYRIKNSGNIASGNNFLESAKFNAQRINTAGLEAAASMGSLLIQGELFHQTVELDSSNTNEPAFTGGYVQAGWTFGNRYRKYKNQKFAKTSGSSNRVVELVAGFGTVDARHENRGDQAQEFTLGLNYSFSKNLMLGLQVQKVDALHNNETLESGTGALVRFVADL